MGSIGQWELLVSYAIHSKSPTHKIQYWSNRMKSTEAAAHLIGFSHSHAYASCILHPASISRFLRGISGIISICMLYITHSMWVCDLPRLKHSSYTLLHPKPCWTRISSRFVLVTISWFEGSYMHLVVVPALDVGIFRCPWSPLDTLSTSSNSIYLPSTLFSSLILVRAASLMPPDEARLDLILWITGSIYALKRGARVGIHAVMTPSHSSKKLIITVTGKL